MPLIPSGSALLDSEELLRRVGLSTDMHYADFGAGTLGHFVLPAAILVGPAGKVYAVDILKSALESIKSRAQMEGVTNLETVWGDFERPRGVKIPEKSLHIISFVNIARVLVKSDVPLDEAKRLLRPNGRALVVDWQKGSGSFVVAEEKRVDTEDIKSRFQSKRFELLEEFEAGPQHWGLIFKLAF